MAEISRTQEMELVSVSGQCSISVSRAAIGPDSDRYDAMALERLQKV